MNWRYKWVALIILFAIIIQLCLMFSGSFSPHLFKRESGPVIDLRKIGVVGNGDRLELLYRTRHIRENIFVYSPARESISNRSDSVKWHRLNFDQDKETYIKDQQRVREVLKKINVSDLPEELEIDFFYNEDPLSYIYRIFWKGEKIIVMYL
jgi:hypothetical protein